MGTKKKVGAQREGGKEGEGETDYFVGVGVGVKIKDW
jgi:hypothetical protein